MTHPNELWHPQQVIGLLWREEQSPEDARILGLARDALRFVSSTGQTRSFEDSRKHLHLAGVTAEPPAPLGLTEHGQADFPGLSEGMNRTERFFTKLRDASGSAKERALIQVILDTLQFISSTGQHADFARFLEHTETVGAPWVVASFASQQEAETWLQDHPNPPDLACVLIKDAYHSVIHDRDTNMRRLPPDRAMSYYLAELKEKEPPAAHLSFKTRQEADAWLQAQAEPARRSWVLIGGELYLAVYYPNIHHRALFPLSLAEGYEAEPS